MQKNRVTTDTIKVNNSYSRNPNVKLDKQQQKIFNTQSYDKRDLATEKTLELSQAYQGSFDDYVNSVFHLNNEMIHCRNLKSAGYFIKDKKASNFLYVLIIL